MHKSVERGTKRCLAFCTAVACVCSISSTLHLCPMQLQALLMVYPLWRVATLFAWVPRTVLPGTPRTQIFGFTMLLTYSLLRPALTPLLLLVPLF